ncbi:MAG: MtrB/PioB family outer membrane beta-barrel protein, partial [Smithellaceae bacterium]|nr:MtrB/PioB family outer membrane beta-barrel protein [Smithellaceae bacterium]
MKLKITISSIILFLAAFSLAFAEGKKLEGEVMISGESLTISGNKASLNEYRDLRDGFYGDVNLRYNSAGYFLNFEGTDIGRNTQNYRLDGGKWGQFKYFVDYDQIKHNFTFDARTFYTGIGTDRLTYTGVVPVGGAAAGTFTPSATIFDYASERKRLGAGFNIDLAKPFFLDVSVSREEKKGLKPTAAGALTGGGYGLELPEPLDYRTDVLKLEMGYATKAFFASANLYYSEFRNEIEKLYHRNPAYAQTAASAVPDVITLPPDNSYYKLSLKGAAALPLNSRFNANLGFSKTKSEADLLNYISSTAAAGWAAITLSDPKFNGELDSQNYDFVLTSNPVSSLDAKVFYKYYKKSNKSDEITTTEGATSFKN